MKKQRYIILYHDGMVGLTGRLTDEEIAYEYDNTGDDPMGYISAKQAIKMAESIIKLTSTKNDKK